MLINANSDTDIIMNNTCIIDKYDRRLSYLRISITDRCNLRCKYCTPLTPLTMLKHDDILQYEEILRIVRVGVRHGISKVRITGGEPLVRLGVYDFLKELNQIEGLNDVSLTTNGVLLKENLDRIKDAGIKRINISLDTLDRSHFQDITGRDYFQKVWEGIHLAQEKGFNPIKLNVVAINGMNEQEIINFAELSIKYPFHIRFIEFMPIGQSDISSAPPLLTPEIKKIAETLGELIPVKKDVNDGPAYRYRFNNAQGELGFISPISNHFCSQCNRLRLTANGNLRSCLLSDHQEDLRTPLRNGCSDEEILAIFNDTMKHKREKHKIGQLDNSVLTQMSSIGG